MFTATEGTAISVVPIGRYKWYVLDKFMGRYFVLATTSLYSGFYNRTPCYYADSKLAEYLQMTLKGHFEDCGVDIGRIANINILTVSQYRRFVKDKLPNIKFRYFLSDPYADDGEHTDCMCAVNSDGEIVPFPADEESTIRPVFYIDCDYLCSLLECSESDIVAVSEYETPENDEDGEDGKDTVPADETTGHNEVAAVETDEAPLSGGFLVPVGEQHMVSCEKTERKPSEKPQEGSLLCPVTYVKGNVVRVGDAPAKTEKPRKCTALAEATNFLEALQAIPETNGKNESQTILLTGENGKKIRVRTNPDTGSYSIYNNDGENSEFADYSVLYRNDDDDYEQLAGEFEKIRITVDKFMAASVVKDRQTVSAGEMLRIISDIHKRW